MITIKKQVGAPAHTVVSNQCEHVVVNPLDFFRASQAAKEKEDAAHLERTAESNSVLDQLEGRRLLNNIEKRVYTVALTTLFEVNDKHTRGEFVSIIEPYLKNLLRRKAIFDYDVVCDDRNNTPEDIENHAFTADIYVKPTEAIEFIQLNFISEKMSVNFDEITEKF